MEKERLKLWLDFGKVIFGTTVVGIVVALLTHRIDLTKASQDDFVIRGEYYERQPDRAIGANLAERIFLAEFLTRFAPTEFDRKQWKEYHATLLLLQENAAQKKADLEVATNEAVRELAEITDRSDDGIAEGDRAQALARKIEENQLRQRSIETQLRGLERDVPRQSSYTAYPAGRLDQPRGIRNNNPVLVARDRWVGLMPESEMTAAQRAEKKFAVFHHPAYGYRAGARIVLRQQLESDTLPSILQQLFIWFGDSDAQRVAADRIASRLGVEANEPVDLASGRKLGIFLTELAKFHNGVETLPYEPEVLAEGLDLAGLDADDIHYIQTPLSSPREDAP